MRFLLTTTYLLLSLVVFSQRDYLYGTVSDSITEETIPGVHIRNLNAQILTTSTEEGRFRLPVKTGDTLVFSHVGYADFSYIVRDSLITTLMIPLSPQVTTLEEVQVSVLPTYSRFKELLIESQPMDSSLVVFGLDAVPKEVYEDMPANRKPFVHDPDLIPIAYGTRFDMTALTRKGKEKKKLQTILANQERERLANKKFNRAWVSKETGLSAAELTDFIAFCQFSVDYLVEASLYQIRERMMALLADFKNRPQKTRKKSDGYSPGAFKILRSNQPGARRLIRVSLMISDPDNFSLTKTIDNA